MAPCVAGDALYDVLNVPRVGRLHTPQHLLGGIGAIVFEGVVAILALHNTDGDTGLAGFATLALNTLLTSLTLFALLAGFATFALRTFGFHGSPLLIHKACIGDAVIVGDSPIARLVNEKKRRNAVNAIATRSTVNAVNAVATVLAVLSVATVATVEAILTIFTILAVAPILTVLSVLSVAPIDDIYGRAVAERQRPPIGTAAHIGDDTTLVHGTLQRGDSALDIGDTLLQGVETTLHAAQICTPGKQGRDERQRNIMLDTFHCLCFLRRKVKHYFRNTLPVSEN